MRPAVPGPGDGPFMAQRRRKWNRRPHPRGRGRGSAPSLLTKFREPRGFDENPRRAAPRARKPRRQRRSTGRCGGLSARTMRLDATCTAARGTRACTRCDHASRNEPRSPTRPRCSIGGDRPPIQFPSHGDPTRLARRDKYYGAKYGNRCASRTGPRRDASAPCAARPSLGTGHLSLDRATRTPNARAVHDISPSRSAIRRPRACGACGLRDPRPGTRVASRVQHARDASPRAPVLCGPHDA